MHKKIICTTKWKQKQAIKHIIRTAASTLCAAALFFSLSVTMVKAKPKPTENETKDTIIAAMHELEGIMTKSYNRISDEIGDLTEDGYDYELTMESFKDLGLPYSDYDYEEFIAAYATIQSYMLENHKNIGNGVNDIKFLSYSYEPDSITEYEPKEMDKYEACEDGTYKKAGTYYINEPCNVTTYEETEKDSGIYRISGTEFVNLKEKRTRYALISLSTIPIEDVYQTFGLNRKDFKEEETKSLNRIKEIMGEADLNQSIFISQAPGATPEDIIDINTALGQISENNTRKNLISTAATIIGRVPYEWGGKSTKPGIDNSWYTFDSTGRQKGLDCSGYIQWVFRTGEVDGWESMESTSAILKSQYFEPISSQDLQPGDLGLYYSNSNGRTNHVGMYLGDGKWIHCSSSKNTVAITNGGKFAIFRRYKDGEAVSTDILPVQDENGDTSIDAVTKPVPKQEEPAPHEETQVESKIPQIPAPAAPAADNELYLMAKIVTKEAYHEGYNGWVGVAQVIRNRVMSEKFPSTITGVVSAPRQFTTYKAATAMKDSDVDPNVLAVCSQVMSGNLSIFDSNDVIAFKRAHSGDNSWGKWHKYTTLGNHSFYTP